ncbi:MAG: FkbM family methyltransferase [Pseudomonadota bacterium]
MSAIPYHDKQVIPICVGSEGALWELHLVLKSRAMSVFKRFYLRSFVRLVANKIGLDPLFLRLRLSGTIKFDKHNNTYVRDIRGNKFHLNPKDQGISRVLAKNGIREKESVDALFQHVHSDMTILDLGANIGFYVLLEAQIVSQGHGRIFALEPGPENIRLLNLNVSANKYENRVTVIQGALSDKTGTAKLELSALSNCHRLALASPPAVNTKMIDVPSFTFTDLLNHISVMIDDVDFLRMDIEGGEYLILDEIIALVKQRESFLMFIEFHPHANLQKHVLSLQQLEAAGFSCLTATKEYIENGRVCRRHCPNTKIHALYSDEFFLQGGGCEVFLQKG